MPDQPTEDVTSAVPAIDRRFAMGTSLRWCSVWALRLVILFGALYLGRIVLGKLWVGVLPLVMALLISSVLWPLVRRLIAWKVPPTLASLSAIILSFALFGGLAWLAAPQIVDQAPDLADSAVDGVSKLQNWVQGPPLNLDDSQINAAIEAVESRITESGDQIAAGAFTSVAAVGSFVVNLLLVLVLTFLMLKDGRRFLPFMRRVCGQSVGAHITEVSMRIWGTLGGYLRTQALVSLIDAVLIGGGLMILQVPLAIPLAIITFIAGFIPIVGAVSAGILSILVALVSGGPVQALIVLGLVLLVQQVEGNILSPILQGKSMQLHSGIVLLSVAAGSTWFGIMGAFLAVPVAATFVVAFRYLDEQIDLTSGIRTPDQLKIVTPEGRASAREVQVRGEEYRLRLAEEKSEQAPHGHDGELAYVSPPGSFWGRVLGFGSAR